jgi:hypothetical protein
MYVLLPNIEDRKNAYFLVPGYFPEVHRPIWNKREICRIYPHGVTRKSTNSEFSTEINAKKTRVMAFRGMEPIRSKICINNKTLKKQNIFNYMGYNISYEGEKDLNIKAANFVKILVITDNIAPIKFKHKS